MMSGEVTQSFFEDRAIVYFRAKNDLGVQLNIVVEQPLQLVRDIGAFFVNP